MNTPGGSNVTTAEHAIALLLALARNIPQAAAAVRAGKWERGSRLGAEVCNKTLGVVGLGNIGAIVAERALGLRMKVIALRPVRHRRDGGAHRRRAGDARRALRARRLHHAPHAAHARDARADRARRHRADEAGRPHRELRARRHRRRGGAGGRDPQRARRRGGARRARARSRRRRTIRCSSSSR